MILTSVYMNKLTCMGKHNSTIMMNKTKRLPLRKLIIKTKIKIHQGFGVCENNGWSHLIFSSKRMRLMKIINMMKIYQFDEISSSWGRFITLMKIYHCDENTSI